MYRDMCVGFNYIYIGVIKRMIHPKNSEHITGIWDLDKENSSCLTNQLALYKHWPGLVPTEKSTPDLICPKLYYEIMY